MLKRHVLVPVCVALVAGAFITICALICLTGARPALIKRKLRLGAILIYLTGLTSCDLFDGTASPTCYAPLPPSNDFSITEPALGPDGVEVDLAQSNIVRGMIERREGTEFSFRIDHHGTEVQRDELAALDGAFDEYAEEFEVAVRPDLERGRYTIRFFQGAAAEQTTGRARLAASFPMNVTGGETER